MDQENRHDSRLHNALLYLINSLAERNLTLSLAESCTGGMLAATITSIANCSKVFSYGVVTYSNSAKSHLLGVKESTLSQFGAVSRETALEMARGIRLLSSSDLALSITGIAGPGGGSAEKPVGLVYIALCGTDGYTRTERCYFKGDRSSVRSQTVKTATDMLVDYLNKTCPDKI